MRPFKRVKMFNADEYRVLKNALVSRKIAAGKARRAQLALLHAREALVATRTKLVNHVRGAVKPFGVRFARHDAATETGRSAPRPRR